MARAPFATWHGDNLPNKTRGQMYGHKGLVVHCDGVDNTSADDNWFHNPKAQASAHFGVRNNGEVVQWVDTDDTAWAEMAGNHYWLSVECESRGEPLTQAQVESVAKLFAWLHKLYGFPLHVTADPDGSGLGHHSMGGADWGDHPYCPGPRIIGQKPEIAHRARAIADAPVETPHKPKPPAPPKVVTPEWYHRELSFPVPASKPGTVKHGKDRQLYQVGDDVKAVQRKLHADDDGWFGPDTVKRVRGFQTVHKLKVDGVVGPHTAEELGK